VVLILFQEINQSHPGLSVFLILDFLFSEANASTLVFSKGWKNGSKHKNPAHYLGNILRDVKSVSFSLLGISVNCLYIEPDRVHVGLKNFPMIGLFWLGNNNINYYARFFLHFIFF